MSKDNIGEDMVDTFIPLIEELTDSVDESSQRIVEAIGGINITPQVTVNVPEIKLPIITVPDIHIPEIKLPVFNVPEQKITVEIPPIKVPTPQVTVNVPKADAPIVNIPDFPTSMGVTASFKDPLPVILTDREGKPYTAEQILQTGGGFKIVNIGDIKASAFTSFQNGDGRLRVSMESGGGSLTDTELRASSVPVSQVSGSVWSTEITNTVPVSVAATLDVKQVSGAIWSVNAFPAGNSYFNVSGATTSTVLKTGAGVIHTLTINTRGTGSVATLYDDIAGVSNPIAAIDTTLSTTAFLYDIAFINGLTLVTSGASGANLTVSYV